MQLADIIEFPNLGITIEHLNRSFSVFGIEIAYYGLIIGIGIVAGYFMATWQAKRTGQDKELYLDFALYAVVLSIIGARLYYVLFSFEEFRDNPLEIFDIRNGGLAIYGGVITGVIVAIIYARARKISFWLLADTACFGLLTGQIIGRWGNFFNREAFGGYTNNALAMRLSVKDVARSSITDEMLMQAQTGGYIGFIQVHPTFLYESIWNLGILLFLIFYTKYKKFDGELFLIYINGYALGRVWIEGLRTDQLFLWRTNIPVSQLLSLLLVCLVTILWLVLRIKASKKLYKM